MGSSIENRNFESRLEMDQGSGRKYLECMSQDLMVRDYKYKKCRVKFGMSAGGVPKASGQKSALETPLHMRRLAALSRRAMILAIDTNQAGLQTFKNKKIWWMRLGTSANECIVKMVVSYVQVQYK